MKIVQQLPSLLVALMVAPFLVSCNDDDLGEFPDTSGIEGRVWVQNEFAQPLHEDRAGIAVFLQTGFRNFNQAADNTGRYRLSGAPVGTYTITYSKPGYSTIVRRNLKLNTASPQYEVINGYHQFPSVTITKLPTTTFDNFSAALQGSANGPTPLQLNINANLVPPPPPTGQPKGYRIFVSNAGDVSPTAYKFQKHMTSTTENIQVSLQAELFSTFPNTPGSVVSVVLYGDANFDETFENPPGTLVFPNLSVQPSQRITVVLP